MSDIYSVLSGSLFDIDCGYDSPFLESMKDYSLEEDLFLENMIQHHALSLKVMSIHLQIL